MEAIKFLQEKERMCGFFDDCAKCGLNYINTKTDFTCDEFIKEYPQQAVAIVEEWSKDNPIYTRLDYLKECFPNVSIGSDGVPDDICVKDLGLIIECCYSRSHSNCIKCWNEPYEK